ncbi:dehydrogenase [Streptomyces sp. CB01580]|nr:dehydrogenase [Streptomyces sp. CB01580]
MYARAPARLAPGCPGPFRAPGVPTASIRSAVEQGRKPSVVSNLAMQVAGTPTFLSTAEQQGVSPELLSPYFALMRRRLAEGIGDEGLTGVIDLLVR